jgi:hypothetical protein
VVAIGVCLGGGVVAWIFRGTLFPGPEPPPPIVSHHATDAGTVAIIFPPAVPDAGSAATFIPYPFPPDASGTVRALDAGRAADAGAAGAGAGTPIQVARQCARDGDHACVVRTLEGQARSEPELALLIDAYRAIGNDGLARRTMRRYMLNYPTTRRATQYRRYLEGVR